MLAKRMVLISTLSLVGVRALGVGARTLGLLVLAAGMPADIFARYALALVLSELARCFSDLGLDTLLLRRAQGLDHAAQKRLLRQVIAVKGINGALCGAAILTALSILYPSSLLLAATGLQFFAQGLLQTALNWRQVNDSAHRVVTPLAVFYLVVIAAGCIGYLVPATGSAALPMLLIGELAYAIWLLGPALRIRIADLIASYRDVVPHGLPMFGILLLGFVNTRTDSLMVTSLLGADGAGRYLYLARWVELVPMFAIALALPLVGKLGGIGRGHLHPLAIAIGLAAIAAPFVLSELVSLANPAYELSYPARVIMPATAAIRVGLAVTTVMLLARWHDRLLFRAALILSCALPVMIWLAGSVYGATGVALAVLTLETCNLLFQARLLLRAPPKATASDPAQVSKGSVAVPVPGDRNDG